MIEDLTYALATALAVTALSTATIAILRRRGWIGPLLDAETRRSLWLRSSTLAIWVFGVTWGRLELAPFLSGSMDWLGTTLAWAAGIALTALGVGVALL